MQYKARPPRNWGRKLKGYAFGWSWFDPVSSWALRRLFVPSSLLWAAAEEAGTSTARFYEAAHLRKDSVNERKLTEALLQVADVRAKSEREGSRMAARVFWARRLGQRRPPHARV